MEKKQSKKNELEIKKVPKEMTGKDLEAVTGGIAMVGGGCSLYECGKDCASD